ALAQLFVKRIVGLRQGEVVYDGPPDGLSAEVLTEIYGVEDWSATVGKKDRNDMEDEATEEDANTIATVPL
ncbi:MAG: phosphonate ABC transporter ATP-binding protein, partial [Desulfopila sp.]